jgi:hypothetical protein
MRQETENKELSNSEYFDSLFNSECGGGELEIHAASILHNCTLFFTYTVECPVLHVTLAKSGDYFAVKMVE